MGCFIFDPPDDLLLVFGGASEADGGVEGDLGRDAFLCVEHEHFGVGAVCVLQHLHAPLPVVLLGIFGDVDGLHS